MNKKKFASIRSLFAFDSLRVQLLMRSLLILAVLLVLIGFLQYVFMRDVVYKNKAASIQSQVMSIPPDAWEQLSLMSETGNMRKPLFFIPDVTLMFIDVQGNAFVLSKGHGVVNPPKLDTQTYLDVLKQKPHFSYQVVDSENGEQLLVLQPIVAPHGHVLGVVQVSTFTKPLKDLLIHQLLTYLFLSMIAMLIGLLGFLPVLKRTLVPLFNMIKVAEKIDAGNLSSRFPTHQGQMEIDRLSESFNSMMDRLEAAFQAERETKEQMRRFIADASHELRTPLTSIHGFLEVLLRGAAQQPDQLQKALRSMYSESERLNKLVHDLLLLAKLDRTPSIELREGLLDAVIREMEPQLYILAGNRKLTLRIGSDIKCKFDPDKMKQVILNLVQNAVQHTDPDNGHIQICLTREENGVVLSVQDNGPGIPKDHLPYIFDRFYRVDSSRTRKVGGAGLGLAITKTIIDMHGGLIQVISKEGDGCTFRVWLPI